MITTSSIVFMGYVLFFIAWFLCYKQYIYKEFDITRESVLWNQDEEEAIKTLYEYYESLNLGMTDKIMIQFGNWLFLPVLLVFWLVYLNREW